ncbi:MAG: hypothetical protein HRU09_15175 [Oligoflexales bacterium]|nr:hypothetical protein [Oligoflexales bacterium]
MIQHEGTSAGVSGNRELELPLLEDIVGDINLDTTLNITLEIEVVVQADFNIDDAKSAALAIWIDHSYQSGGLNDGTVDILQSLYDNGVPLYFVADDIAFSISQNLTSVEKQDQLSQLCHLGSSMSNGSSPISIELNGTSHPIVDRPYAAVQNFDYSFDSDEDVSPIGAGEVLLATRTGGSAALVAYEGSPEKPPVVTQTFLIAGGDAVDTTDRTQLSTYSRIAYSGS